MTEHDAFYLGHIAEWADRIEAYTAVGREAFMASTLHQDGTIRGFMVIGEAVKRLSDETCARAPEVPWRQVAGFRDVLVHDYIGVDVGLGWETVEQNLPALRRAVERLLADNP
ncbi:DUF86 domain-containing protein [Rubrivirga sp. IMCC45206]|uniref:HepT-like ribonuclease domain-containing protein n=1 Tax=Rubrivirga sp. IMCC45206 TaxID=3391614 RepID=UPI00398F8F98